MATNYRVLQIQTADRESGRIKTVDLLSPRSGFCLTEWRPAVAGPKGEGVWQDSPLAHGRRLKVRRRQNATEALTLALRNFTPDDLIEETQELRRLLEKAVAYGEAGWQDDPVWLKRQGIGESRPTYSIIHDYRTPQDDNPYGSDTFWNDVARAAFPEFTLVLEREPEWWANQPGDCLEGHTEQEETEEHIGISWLEFDGDTCDVNCDNDLSLQNLPDNAVAGKGFLWVDGWVRADGLGEGNLGMIICKRLYAIPTVNGWYLHISTAGLDATVRCQTHARSASGVDEFTYDGLWHHVTMVYSEIAAAGIPVPRMIYLAVDGVWVTTYYAQQASIGNYSSDTLYDLYIGNDQSGDFGWDGGIGWMRIRDAFPLGIAVGTNFTPPARCELPPVVDGHTLLQVIYEGYGPVTEDRSGYKNSGTITNAVWSPPCPVEWTHTPEGQDCRSDCVQASGQQAWNSDIIAVNTGQPGAAVLALAQLSSGRILAADVNNAGNGDVWRTDDYGVSAWTAAATNFGAGRCALCFAAESATVVLAAVETAGPPGFDIYRSPDGGVNWAAHSAFAAGSLALRHALVYRQQDGFYYLCGSWGISRSVDGGLTWTPLYTSLVECHSLFVTSSGALVCSVQPQLGGEAACARSEDGAAWEIAALFGGASQVNGFCELEGVLYAGDQGGGIYASVDDGRTWSRVAQLDGTVDDVIAHENGLLYAITTYLGNGYLNVSRYGALWKRYPNTVGTAAYYSLLAADNGLLLMGDDGNIYDFDPAEIVLGRAATCADEVFVANKQNLAQLTHVYEHDSVLGNWPAHFPSATFPFNLLPNPLANGDGAYFGIETSVLDSGPFHNLVFDVGTPASGQFTIGWEYWNGVAWWPLPVQDGTASFMQPGVNSVHWMPPTDWAAVDLSVAVPGGPGFTAYWVRALVGGVVGIAVAPTQTHRDVYTVDWPCVDVDAAQVGGDVAALLRLKLHNRADRDGPLGECPEAWVNRYVVGLRSLSRGAQFVAALNLADEQNPIGVAVAAGAGTIFDGDLEAPSGRKMTHATDGLGAWADVATVTLGPSIARDFYGAFRVFLRAQQLSYTYEMGEVLLRLKVVTGSGGVQAVSARAPFANLNPWQLLDFGQVDIPASGLLRHDELGDQTQLIVQAWSSQVGLLVDLFDIWTIPADEWLGDFCDVALTEDSCVENGYLFDADSVIYNPKKPVRALVRTADAAGFVRSIYNPITPAPAILQANADQRLYVLCARAALTGWHTGADDAAALEDSRASFLTSNVKVGMVVYNITDGSSAVITDVDATTVEGTLVGGAENDWDIDDLYLIICPTWRSEPWACHSVQLAAIARYLGLRGAR